MTTTEDRRTVPEAARLLDLPGEEVYKLIFSGALAARRGGDGAVYIDSDEIDSYEQRRMSPSPS